MEKRFIIIDGNSLINRAYYAMQRPMITKEGVYTQGIYGFLRMLQKIEKEHPAGHIAVAFDMKAPTFRHKEYEEYKAGRKKMPPELAMQMPLLKEVLDAMRIRRVEKEGFEADDLIGTMAVWGEANGLIPLIITGDRDELQLATDVTKVLITRKGISQFDLFDRQTMIDKYGFTPQQFIDFKGLMGDPSDNIPGLPGVGEKTAQKLILEYGSVEGMLEHTDRLAGKLKTTVEENAQLALMSKRLATIHTAVPLDLAEEDLRWEEADSAALLELYKKLEFTSFIRTLHAGAAAEGGRAGHGGTGADAAEVSAAGGRKLPPLTERLEAVETTVIRSATDASWAGLQTALEKADEVVLLRTFGDADAVDLSTANEPVCQAASFLINNVYYYVVLEDKDLRTAFSDLLAKDLPAFGGGDLKQDYLRLMGLAAQPFGEGAADASPDFVTAFDTSIAEYVLDPGRSDYSLPVLGKEYLSFDLMSEKEFREAHAQVDLLSDLHEQQAAWGLTWCAVSEQVAALQEAALMEQEAWKVYREIELPLIPVMASMEYLGFGVDSDTLRSIGEGISARVEELTQQIYELAGEEFNIKSPAQLGPILFEKLGLPAGKKTKKGYSTSADILENIRDLHPIVPLILEYRSVTKLQGTYIDGLIPLIRGDRKIHAHFNQTVTATGRISSSDPNLQNIPIRQELGRTIRKAFIPDEGCLLVGADYSQIELRVLAHMSGDEALIEAFNNGEDIHRATASRVLGIPEDKISAAERSRAKAVNFGVIYGMSSFGLSSNLHITRKEAERYITDYFAKHEKVKVFMDEQVAMAKDQGYVTTLLGRRRYIKEIHASNYMVRQMGERLAMNSPIQGTAADIIKIAMVNIYRALRPYRSRLILQVHDELIINTYKEEEKDVRRLLTETMESALALAVRLEVDVNEGDNWYALK